MSNALKKAIRTFIQAFLGSIITSGVLSAIAVQGIVDFKVIQKVGTSALAAGIIALITYLMNALEDHEVIPALLKNVPSEPKAAEADNQIVDMPPEAPPAAPVFPEGYEVKERPEMATRVVKKVSAKKVAAKKAAPDRSADRAKALGPVKKAAKKAALPPVAKPMDEVVGKKPARKRA